MKLSFLRKRRYSRPVVAHTRRQYDRLSYMKTIYSKERITLRCINEPLKSDVTYFEK